MFRRGALGFVFFYFQASFAASNILDVNLIDPNNLGGLIPQNVADESIRFFGNYLGHRPYTGATSLHQSNSADFLVEATLLKMGDGLLNALKSVGGDGGQTTPAGVPIAKLHLRKSWGPRFEFGFSGLSYRAQSIYGGDFKIVLHEPEEGPSYAVRLNYTTISIPYAYIQSINTYGLDLVMSRRLYFAEPYIGIGGRLMRGTLSIPFQGTPPLIQDFTVTKSGSASSLFAFTGIYFRIIGAQGLRLGIEGSYERYGYHTLGLVIGIGF